MGVGHFGEEEGRRVWLKDTKQSCGNAELRLPGGAGEWRNGEKIGIERERIHQQQMKRRLGAAEGAGEEGCLAGVEVQ